MKKKLFTIAIALCMVFTMMPAGVFQIDTAWADTSSYITIAGKTLSTSEGLCYHNDGTVDFNEKTANAIFNPNTGEITLNGLEVNTDGKGIEAPHFDNMTIILNGQNIIKTVSMQNTAINGNASSSVTIKGSGSLELEGSYGIWVWNDITIEGNVKVDVTATNIGLCNNSSSGNISIASTAEVTVDGGTYGIGADHELKNAATISGANLVVKGGTAALQKFPTFDSNQYSVIGNTSKEESGASAVDLTESNVTNYKYLQFTQAHTHCICGAAHENVGDHATSKEVTFNAWNDTDRLPTSSGYYYLKNDVTLGWTWSLEKINDGVILCLNGHKISTKNDGWYTNNNLIKVDKSNLTLTDCRDTGKVINDGNVSNIKGIDVSYSGYPDGTSIFNMYKIAIERFTNGGVNLTNNAGKFNMYSGVIQNNSSEYYGGGVTAYPNHGFFMYGGTITNNTTGETGGGVWVNASNSFIIGGKVTITGNYKDTGTEKVANNVYLANNDNIAISNTASTESTIGVTTRITPTEGSSAVTIAKGADGANINLGSFTNCFTSDVNSSRIWPVLDGDAIKLQYFAKEPQTGFKFVDSTDVNEIYGINKKFTRTATGQATDSTITYSSDNEEVATVNSKTGEAKIEGTGTAVITATASATENYAEAKASYTINVAHKEITAPTADATKYVYDGTEKFYNFTDTQDELYYTIRGNDTPRINANEDGYTITVSLGDKRNTVWADTKDTADKTYKFVIARKAIEAPDADTTVFTYTGEEQTYNIAPSAGGEYTVTGNTQTDAGTYTVKVTPNANYKWNDGTSGDKTYQFVIQKQQIADPELIKSTFVYSGETITPEFKEKPEKFTLVGATSAKDAYVDGSYMITATPKANYKLSDNREFVNLLWNITKADLTIQPKDISIQEGDELPTNFEVDYNKLKGSDKAETAVTGTMQFELLKDDGTVLSDSKTAGEYIIRVKNAEEITSKNYNLKFETAKLTITKKPSSGGGGSYIQRPTIVTDEGGNASLNYNGSKLTITAKDGYEITDVLVNGVSKGAVAEITGLKTGDKVEVKTAKKAEPTEPTKPSTDNNAKLIKGVENTTIALKSKLTKNGNVLLTWTKSKGYKADCFEIYRSVKRNSGYGKAAFFTTKDGSWSKYLNTKNLKAGKTYYYKVRGVRVIDGKEYYTQWSNKAWRTIK